MKLTTESARNIQPGQIIRDHVVKGLQLRCRAQVTSWHYWYRNAAGQERKPKIGAYPSLSIEAAREAAKRWQLQVARGEDPSGERQDLRQSATLADLFELYQAEHVAKLKRETQEQAIRAWKLYILPHLGSMTRVAAITGKMSRDMLEKIGSEHPTTANRVRAYASSAFELAEHIDRRWREPHTNPFRQKGTPHFKERKRKVLLSSPAEFAAIRRELDKLAPDWPYHVAFIKVMFFAGTRVTELAKARQEHLQGNRIVLTEHKTDRTGDDRTIRLPRQALEILHALPSFPSGHLFGPLGQMTRPRHAVWRIWDMARDAASHEFPTLASVQPRDVRRTFASAAKTNGASLDQIGELLDHHNTETTARYAFLFGEEADALTQGTADELQRRMEG